jgi:hypothetical protein
MYCTGTSSYPKHEKSPVPSLTPVFSLLVLLLRRVMVRMRVWRACASSPMNTHTHAWGGEKSATVARSPLHQCCQISSIHKDTIARWGREIRPQAVLPDPRVARVMNHLRSLQFCHFF